MDWRDLVVIVEGIVMILTAMRGDSALSRGAGNELMPESDSGLTDCDERDGARSKDRYAKRGKTKMHRL